MFAWQCDLCEATVHDHDATLIYSYSVSHYRLVHPPETVEC